MNQFSWWILQNGAPENHLPVINGIMGPLKINGYGWVTTSLANGWNFSVFQSLEVFSYPQASLFHMLVDEFQGPNLKKC